MGYSRMMSEPIVQVTKREKKKTKQKLLKVEMCADMLELIQYFNSIQCHLM